MLRNCAACGKTNRIPAARLAESARCGSCKAALEPLNTPLEVGAEELDEIVRTATVPVLIDFWAAWCMPCRMAAREVARVAREMAGEAIVLKVDTEKHPQLAARFGVQGIPNFAVLSGGNLVLQEAGLVDHRQLERWLTEAARTT